MRARLLALADWERFHDATLRSARARHGSGSEVSAAGAPARPGEEQRKRKKPIEADLKEIVERLNTTVELLRGRDRRWEVLGKRAKAVAILVHDREHTVSDVAKRPFDICIGNSNHLFS
jgi:hypothetical protein